MAKIAAQDVAVMVKLISVLPVLEIALGKTFRVGCEIALELALDALASSGTVAMVSVRIHVTEGTECLVWVGTRSFPISSRGQRSKIGDIRGPRCDALQQPTNDVRIEVFHGSLLAGVVVEVVQLDLSAVRPEDQLPRVVDDGDADTIVRPEDLADDRTAFGVIANEERVQALSRPSGQRLEPGQLDQGRGDIQQTDGCRDSPWLYSRRLQDERDVNDLVVQGRAMASPAVLPELLAVVRGQDDRSVVPNALSSEKTNQIFESGIPVVDRRVVSVSQRSPELRRPGWAEVWIVWIHVV